MNLVYEKTEDLKNLSWVTLILSYTHVASETGFELWQPEILTFIINFAFYLVTTATIIRSNFSVQGATLNTVHFWMNRREICSLGMYTSFPVWTRTLGNKDQSLQPCLWQCQAWLCDSRYHFCSLGRCPHPGSPSSGATWHWLAGLASLNFPPHFVGRGGEGLLCALPWYRMLKDSSTYKSALLEQVLQQKWGRRIQWTGQYLRLLVNALCSPFLPTSGAVSWSEP